MYEYAGLYDEKHRFIIEKTTGTAKSQYEQKGLREVLLCKECESKISTWEKYAGETLYGGKQPEYVKETGEWYGEHALFTGIDYKKFKLLLLSILWRASVTKLDEFSQVNLGPHEERIRKMLFEEDPGDEDDYGLHTTAVIWEKIAVRGLVFPPSPVRVRHHNCYRILIGSFLHHFFISKHNIPAGIRALFLNRSNELRVLIRKADEIPFLMDNLMNVAFRRREIEK